MNSICTAVQCTTDWGSERMLCGRQLRRLTAATGTGANMLLKQWSHSFMCSSETIQTQQYDYWSESVTDIYLSVIYRQYLYIYYITQSASSGKALWLVDSEGQCTCKWNPPTQQTNDWESEWVSESSMLRTKFNIKNMAIRMYYHRLGPPHTSTIPKFRVDH